MRVQDMNAGPMEVPSRLQILVRPWVYVVNFLRNPWMETAFLCFTNGRTKTQTPKWPFQNFIMLVGSTKGSHSGVLPGCSFTSAGHILHCIVVRRSCWKSLENGWKRPFFFQRKQVPDSFCFDLGVSRVGDGFTLNHSCSFSPCFYTGLGWVWWLSWVRRIQVWACNRWHLGSLWGLILIN